MKLRVCLFVTWLSVNQRNQMRYWSLSFVFLSWLKIFFWTSQVPAGQRMTIGKRVRLERVIGNSMKKFETKCEGYRKSNISSRRACFRLPLKFDVSLESSLELNRNDTTSGITFTNVCLNGVQLQDCSWNKQTWHSGMFIQKLYRFQLLHPF